MVAQSKSNRIQKSRFQSRSGLSLLEIVLAIAVFGMAMIIITNMYFLGYRSALRARLLSDANILCDAKMAELASGVIPASSVSGQLIEEQRDWSYSVNIQPSLQPGLLVATVTVTQSDPNAAMPLAVSIARFLPDPDYEPSQ